MYITEKNEDLRKGAGTMGCERIYRTAGIRKRNHIFILLLPSLTEPIFLICFVCVVVRSMSYCGRT